MIMLHFLSAFAKFRNATVDIFLCLAVRPHGPTRLPLG